MMHWTFGIKHKWRLATSLAVVFALMLFNNILESRRANELELCFNSVYDDRLVVEGYIFELSSLLYENRLMLDACAADLEEGPVQSRINENNSAVNQIVAAYAETSLSEEEERIFSEFKTEISDLTQLENTYFMYRNSPTSNHLLSSMEPRLHSSFYKAGQKLNELSAIQMDIGKTLRDDSRKMIAGSQIFSTLEIGMLIVLGLFIQVIIFSARLSKSKKPVEFHMN